MEATGFLLCRQVSNAYYALRQCCNSRFLGSVTCTLNNKWLKQADLGKVRTIEMYSLARKKHVGWVMVLLLLN